MGWTICCMCAVVMLCVCYNLFTPVWNNGYPYPSTGELINKSNQIKHYCN